MIPICHAYPRSADRTRLHAGLATPAARYKTALHALGVALRPEMAEGAGTIALELEASGPIDLAVVQVGDGALISGIACWFKHVRPATQVVGVCDTGRPIWSVQLGEWPSGPTGRARRQ